MVKTTVYLDDDISAALKRLANRSSRPAAQLIRDALRAFTEDGNAPPLPSGMGMFDSRSGDTSARRKQILRKAARSRQWRS